jgi:hypothetical protein
MKLSNLIKAGAVILPVLAVALPGHALAAATQVVTLQCDNFAINTKNATQFQRLASVNASVGNPLPATCGANSACVTCLADLLTNGFTAVNSFDTTPLNGGNPTPYFIFKK